MDCFKRLSDAKIIPVAVIDRAQRAIPTALAMAEGGIDVMEITFRTAAAEDALCAVSKACPEILTGAGTVITLEQCRRAVDAGAQFIVSPGLDELIVRWCTDRGVAVIPGCATPSEIMAAMRLGLHTVKFFPANAYGGLSALKSLAAPFGAVRFIPTGGIDAGNLSDYLSAFFVLAVGGSWVCPRADIAAGSYEKITKLCRETRRIALACAAHTLEKERSTAL